MTLHAVPRVGRDLIDRPDISARLDEATPLVVLHAPSGYGKSTVLAQWATVTTRTGLWLRIRDGIAEPAAFVQALSAELSSYGLLDAGNPLATAAETLLTTTDPWGLLARGLRRLPGDLTLVLDETERLFDETVDGLLQLVADLPTLSIRLSTRKANGFTEPGIALAFDVDRIDAAELALTADEIAAIVGTSPDSPAVAQIVELGAPASLARLAALGASQGQDSVESVIDSLLRMRSADWDERFASFLARISLTDSVDAALAADLTGESDAARLLDRAEREGVGLLSPPPPGQPGGALFAVSPVFRRRFAAAIRQQLPPEELRRLEICIAQWYLARGRAVPAVRSAVAARDWELTSDIVRAHWGDLVRSSAQTREIFANVPKLTLRNYPLITVLLAIIANSTGEGRLRALEYFGLALYGARAQREKGSPADRALLRTIETSALRVSGKIDTAAGAAIDGYQTMLEMGPAELDRLGRNEPTVYSQLGVSLFYGGDAAHAVDCFRRSFASGLDRGVLTGLQGIANEAGVHAVAGDMPEAAAAAALADRQQWPEGWLNDYAGSMLQIAHALLALEQGDLERAEDRLALLESHRRTLEHWAIIEHTHAVLTLLRGEPETARVHLERAIKDQRSRHAVHPLMLARVQEARVVIELALGNHAAARRMIGKMPSGRAQAVSAARLHLAQNDPNSALRVLAAATEDKPSSRLSGEHLALTAAATALTGDPAAAEALARLSSFVTERELTLPLALVPVSGLDALLQLVELSDPLAAQLARARERAPIGTSRPQPKLTSRELVVARELARSSTVPQIAQALVVSPNTVKTQIRSLYKKLDVNTRDEALAALIVLGIADEWSADEWRSDERDSAEA